MLKILFLAIFITSSAMAGHPIEGRWQGNGAAIDFFSWKGQITGSLHGPTDYLFSYDPVTLVGSLVTYDSKYGCRLENGESQIRVIDTNKIEMIFNRINFNISKTYIGSRAILGPIYCDYGFGPFICSWEELPRRPSKVECEITLRQPVRVELEKISFK